MTDPGTVTLREHIDLRFDGVEDRVRGVHRRLDEVQAYNSREHSAVSGHLQAVSEKHQYLEGRVDTLEGQTDRRAGAQAFARRVAILVAGVISAGAGLTGIYHAFLA